jgi:hypothetical protein
MYQYKMYFGSDVKPCGLYPEGHTITRQEFEHFLYWEIDAGTMPKAYTLTQADGVYVSNGGKPVHETSFIVDILSAGELPNLKDACAHYCDEYNQESVLFIENANVNAEFCGA